MSILFKRLEKLEPEEDKKIALENADFPIISIDHRRFEKLIYWLYRAKIERGIWKGKFDDIQLMSGVRDNGRDIALFLQNQLVGIIQCKHSENSVSLTVPIFIKGVIKYVLYEVKERTVIPDIKNFVYYIASSSGFNEDCNNLIRNFNISVCSLEKLKPWTESVIKNHAFLKDLIYENIEKPA